MGSSQADELSLSHDLSTTLSRPTTQERFLTFSEEAPALRSYGICRVFQRVEEVRVCLSLSLFVSVRVLHQVRCLAGGITGRTVKKLQFS